MSRPDLSKLRVWRDRKRDCHVTNLALLIGEAAAFSVVAQSLDQFRAAGVESLEYEHPRLGVLWSIEL